MVVPKGIEPHTRSSPKLRVKSEICTTPLFANKEFIYQKYHVEGVSARQLAVLIGCAHSTINRALEEMGIRKEPRISGWVPYGYKYERGVRIPHVREQIVIRKILERKSKGWSNHRIADWLNKKSIKSPSRKAIWYPCTVGRIARVALGKQTTRENEKKSNGLNSLSSAPNKAPSGGGKTEE